MPKTVRNKKDKAIDKIIEFGRQLFAAILRSRTGALTELARILRFNKGTKGFEREHNKLIPLITEIKEAYYTAVLENLPLEGLRLGIFDDSDIEKTGKQFPKQKTHHNHTTDSFFSGMKILSSAVYHNGKTAVVDSQIIGEKDNKLDEAKNCVDKLIADFLVDIFLFDSWYCKNPLLEYIQNKEKLFVSRLRRDSKAEFDKEQERLDALFKEFPHKEYTQIKIKGKSYWVKDVILELKAYGKLRVIISKEGQFDEPIFLVTNAYTFTPKFIVKLYLKRFSIEVFFKDAKQYLNFESFFCRKECKWDLHLLLTNILHWSIQTKNSISKTVRKIRENVDKCLFFINQNPLIHNFFEELMKKCLI